MALQHWYDGTLLTSAVQLRSEMGMAAYAQIGEVATIALTVEDPNATHNFVGYKSWRIVETSAPTGNQTVWYGYVWRQRISRGEGDEGDTLYLTGSSRRWELELVEANSILGRRVLRDASANRASETVTARLTWLLTQQGMAGVVVDHGLVETSTVTCDAVDYRGRTPLDVLRDMALACGYNFYVRYRDASSDLELAFLDARLSTLDSSASRISNVAADIDLSLTWPPSTNATLVRDPSRVASGVYLPYTGGSAYGQNVDTAFAFGSNDRTAPTSSVKTAAAANTLVARLLEEHNEQDQRLTDVRVVVPAADVNDVRQGQLINVKLAHLPSFGTFRPARVASRSVGRLPNLATTHYALDLELTPEIPAAQIVQTVYGQSGDGWPVTLTFDSPVTAGNLLIVALAVRGNGANGVDNAMGAIKRDNAIGPGRPFTNAGSPTYAWATLDDSRAGIGYRTATGDEQVLYIDSTKTQITIWEVSGAQLSGREVLALAAQPATVLKTLTAWTDPHRGGLQLAIFLWDPSVKAVSQDAVPFWVEVYETQDYSSGDGKPGTSSNRANRGTAAQITGTAYVWGAVGINLRAASG